MTFAYFITGTDTEIGKTFVACSMLHAWRASGAHAIGYKPVAAGTVQHADGEANEDAVALLAASSPGLSLAEVNPICFREAAAPHIAAHAQARAIDMATIESGFERLKDRADRIVVEGVGGFLVPLDDQLDASAIPLRLNLPVILVVGMRLGCLNHALLSVEAIRSRGLKLAGWFANSLSTQMPRFDENVASLRPRIDAPCLGVIPRVAHPRDALGYMQLEKLEL